MSLRYVSEIRELLDVIEDSQKEEIEKAGLLITESIMSGGIVQAFGSGHSYAAAIEVAGRAGGLIPTKAIQEPSKGAYETIEGVGTAFTKKLDLRKEDVLILISNSGRNPLSIEFALYAKEVGCKVIVVTSLEASKKLTSKHSSGKNLYEYADVVLDNCVKEGDASIEVEGMKQKVCGTSSVAAAVLLNSAVLHAVETMIKQGYNPPVYMSQNLDGGPEFNERLVNQYKDRIYRI